jgi:3-phenylpropionate/trans-cinnamate dioxygenase ferredoxin subunit
MVALTLEGHQILIIRDGARLFAAERACPHEGADLSRGRCAEGRLHCPRHLAWFDLISGAVSPGWSFRGLKTYPVRVAGNDVLIDLSPTAIV